MRKSLILGHLVFKGVSNLFEFPFEGTLIFERFTPIGYKVYRCERAKTGYFIHIMPATIRKVHYGLSIIDATYNIFDGERHHEFLVTFGPGAIFMDIFNRQWTFQEGRWQTI